MSALLPAPLRRSPVRAALRAPVQVRLGAAGRRRRARRLALRTAAAWLALLTCAWLLLHA